MKALKGIGIFLIIAGLAIIVCGALAMTVIPSMPFNGGIMTAVGIGVGVIGVILMMANHSHNLFYAIIFGFCMAGSDFVHG